MTIKSRVRNEVRQRASFACEFCGISETDAGSQLTIDHFQPKAKGGDDSPSNLIYCCSKCNQYKLDYWPENDADPMLWNPRIESASQHFLELNEGTLHPLSSTGAFTIRRLRLNRPPLIAHRLFKRRVAEEVRLLTSYKDLVRLVEQLLAQQSALLQEQQKLLTEQRQLLQMLLEKKK